MRRVINYSEKYSLKFFLNLLTVRLLRTINGISFLPSDSKLVLMTSFMQIKT